MLNRPRASVFLTQLFLNWPYYDSDFQKKSEVWLWLTWANSESSQFNGVNWRQENTTRGQLINIMSKCIFNKSLEMIEPEISS